MWRILVIDHDPMVRYAVRLVLEDQGHRVEEAADGRAARAALRAARFDAAITDMILPDMKGIETVRAIRARVPDLPILTMTSGLHAFAEDSGRVFARIADEDMLAKPFETDELIAALDRTLTRPKAA